MFLLVLAYLGSPGSKAVKWLCACGGMQGMLHKQVAVFLPASAVLLNAVTVA